MAASNKVIAEAFDKAGFVTKPATQYGTLNIAIGDACDAPFEPVGTLSKRFLWEKCSKEQLQLREEIQITVSNLIKLGMITNFGQGIAAIKGLAKRFS